MRAGVNMDINALLLYLDFLWLGIEFINQLCVEDDERAATLLAASNKSVSFRLFPISY